MKISIWTLKGPISIVSKILFSIILSSRHQSVTNPLRSPKNKGQESYSSILCVCVYIYIYIYIYTKTFQIAQMVKNWPAMWEIWVLSLGGEDPLEKETATNSSITPGEFHGQRNLGGYSLWHCKDLDWTEQLSLSISYVYIYHNHRKLIKLITWTTALSNSMKLQPCCVEPHKMDKS